MPLVRYSPFPELGALQRQMNRLFEDVLYPGWREEGEFNLNPAAELSETDEAIHLKLELPGMEAKDIDIQVTKEAVSISGERKQESKTEKDGVTRSEFRYGKFERVIPLPVEIDNTHVSAEYKDGILTLDLPKVEEEKTKVIKVNL